MRRVLVPLDGTEAAASILPDARRLAGPDGQLLLVRDVSVASDHSFQSMHAMHASTDDLGAAARALRADGVTVEEQPLLTGSAAFAVDLAVTLMKADMVAMATYGRSLMQRHFWGSIAWHALANSPVPVFLHRAPAAEVAGREGEPEAHRILVPLDGSSLAEKALPLAQTLAAEWKAALWLVRVVSDSVTTQTAGMSMMGVEATQYDDDTDDARAARTYLDRVTGDLPGDVHRRVLSGPAADALAAAVEEWSITAVVMTSHGRTGLARVLLGSVADPLIHRLHCPIVVIPPLALAEPE
jgi:nucleotide-binding universal stress UspA family protein